MDDMVNELEKKNSENITKKRRTEEAKQKIRECSLKQFENGMPEETKKKISDALKGRMPKFIPDNTGRVISEDHRRKISETLKRKGIRPSGPPPKECIVRGKDHPFWKGGLTSINKKIRQSPEYQLWRKSVFERDDYTCVLCGNRPGKGNKVELNADHIKPFSLFKELRFVLENGRTLCHECHVKTDTFGKNIKHYKL